MRAIIINPYNIRRLQIESTHNTNTDNGLRSRTHAWHSNFKVSIAPESRWVELKRRKRVHHVSKRDGSTRLALIVTDDVAISQCKVHFNPFLRKNLAFGNVGKEWVVQRAQASALFNCLVRILHVWIDGSQWPGGFVRVALWKVPKCRSI